MFAVRLAAAFTDTLDSSWSRNSLSSAFIYLSRAWASPTSPAIVIARCSSTGSIFLAVLLATMYPIVAFLSAASTTAPWHTRPRVVVPVFSFSMLSIIISPQNVSVTDINYYSIEPLVYKLYALSLLLFILAMMVERSSSYLPDPTLITMGIWLNSVVTSI